MLVIAMLIKAEDGGDVIFSQSRVGKGGVPFRIWKFRTMRPHSDGGQLQITAANDDRITRIGGWLRRKKLDELPQLLNVLIGEMSLVGPRPEVPKYVAMYNAEQRGVLDLKPGITDRASLLYSDEAELLANTANPELLYVERIMPEKIRINLEDARQPSLLRDLKVLIATAHHLNPFRS
jgi:lipopolysaccharide/colanic/teichoic acid biosynthesis glycosyltransferase